MKISSSAFDDNSSIPSKYTCDGENVSPPLSFENVPEAAKSLALIMDDPDVPKSIRPDGMWVHWVVFNLPSTTTTISEGQQPEGTGGNSTYERTAYGGPCPPDREHRYFFKLYALDIELILKEGAAKEEIEKAMEGHILEQAELVGRYERQ